MYDWDSRTEILLQGVGPGGRLSWPDWAGHVVGQLVASSSDPACAETKLLPEESS